MIAVLIKKIVRFRFDIGPFHRIGCLVPLIDLDPVADAPHLHLRHRCAFAGMKIVRIENDVEPALVILEDVAFAQAAGDNFGHFGSLSLMPRKIRWRGTGRLTAS